jgi:hypothetical protein
MHTENLVRALAADNATRARSVESYLALALLPALAVAGASFLLVLGPRPDIAVALTDPRIIFKFVLTVALAGASVWLACRLARPGSVTRLPALTLLLVPLLLGLAVVVEMLSAQRSSWAMKLIGNDLLVCLISIPLLSVPMLIAALAALRHGAPTRPGLSGAVAGLAAGGLGATIYAFYCPNDSPFFAAAWYSLAIAVVAIAGGIAGRLLLRW